MNDKEILDRINTTLQERIPKIDELILNFETDRKGLWNPKGDPPVSCVV
jgi:hypothetical protein